MDMIEGGGLGPNQQYLQVIFFSVHTGNEIQNNTHAYHILFGVRSESNSAKMNQIKPSESIRLKVKFLKNWRKLNWNWQG